MLLPEEAEELLEPLFLSMSEAVAAALGELCGINGPIFPSGCEGKLGVALESLQGLRDLT